MKKQEMNNILHMFPEKICNDCKKLLPLENYASAKKMRDGKKNVCRPCWNKYIKSKRKDNPERQKEIKKKSNIWSKYKITLDQYKVLLESQNYRCSICNTHEKDLTAKKNVLNVDHCHKTGKVRGLLCPRCNMGIGMFKDDTNTLKSAISYLRKHSV